jgi:hypothetical protein
VGSAVLRPGHMRRSWGAAARLPSMLTPHPPREPMNRLTAELLDSAFAPDRGERRNRLRAATDVRVSVVLRCQRRTIVFRTSVIVFGKVLDSAASGMGWLPE